MHVAMPVRMPLAAFAAGVFIIGEHIHRNQCSDRHREDEAY